MDDVHLLAVNLTGEALLCLDQLRVIGEGVRDSQRGLAGVQLVNGLGQAIA